MTKTSYYLKVDVNKGIKNNFPKTKTKAHSKAIDYSTKTSYFTLIIEHFSLCSGFHLMYVNILLMSKINISFKSTNKDILWVTT